MFSPEEKEILNKACTALREISDNAPFLVIFAFDRGPDMTTVCVGSNLSQPDHHTILSMAMEGYANASPADIKH